MSVSETALPSTCFDSVIVVGGGCYGAYYLRQLDRARTGGAVSFRRLVIVDKDPDCRVAAILSEKPVENVELVTEDWTSFFDRYLSSAGSESTDAIVPSPLMPHLMYEWVLRRAKRRWPDRKVDTRPLSRAMGLPWESQSPDGTQYGSFATWMCPINCIEPRKCPHTRGPRSWSMPIAAREYVEELKTTHKSNSAESLQGPVIFHCTHRAYGVGMFETREVLAGDAFIAEAGDKGPAEVLVGTVSHCHGAFNVLHLGV